MIPTVACCMLEVAFVRKLYFFSLISNPNPNPDPNPNPNSYPYPYPNPKP